MTTISQLPKPTQVNKVVPKNAFDIYCNPQQKRLFVEKIEKIQCFEIDVRTEEGIDEVLKIIDRAIPYPILFQLTTGKFKKGMISKKHPHPNNEDNSVIDWTFKSTWLLTMLKSPLS